MKTTIQYLTHTPALSDGFYHADCPVLFAEHDTITSLKDCPFPLETDSFKVLLFGTVKDQPDDTEKGHGYTKRFAVVEYAKSCGHTVQERIQFAEGVKTFTSYGTTFEGVSYSVVDWKRRIEYFRNTPCDVCSIVNHCLWVYAAGIGWNSRPGVLKRCKLLLDANFGNWQDFVSFADIERRLKATVYASDKVAE